MPGLAPEDTEGWKENFSTPLFMSLTFYMDFGPLEGELGAPLPLLGQGQNRGTEDKVRAKPLERPRLSLGSFTDKLRP